MTIVFTASLLVDPKAQGSFIHNLFTGVNSIGKAQELMH
ncbi:hypothetical protein EV13_0189 [Prochlorococcus sp. MIT 0702]|nr:hypothetical protein EV12_0200 [Prochlorococcus sp. MIT 0701]KGG30529.1 hypothetical protein EV13_0189 [Prochlorococcus sp. MIT 0702]KGG37045.1 hypothetical protein EV14_0145 [Prochlorococcus sp. MIT 0703]